MQVKGRLVSMNTERMFRVRTALLGDQEQSGLLFKLLIYFLLLNVAFMYLTPFFYMVSTMMKGNADLLDPTVRWIPRTFNWENITLAWEGLRFPVSLQNSLKIVVFGALFQVIFCSLAGYTFARMQFPGKMLLFGLCIFSFLVPPQTLVIPLFILFKDLGWLGSAMAVVGPAIFGHGIKGALFVIIFRQFFLTLPKELEEAAYMDGAGSFRVYWRVMLPLAAPAITVVFLFSFIWHWNETEMASLMLRGQNLPLSLSLSNLNSVLNGLMGNEAAGLKVNEALKMAASFLIIMPPLVVYAFTQKWFVEGVERTGVVE